jgi:hypothetical protein
MEMSSPADRSSIPLSDNKPAPAADGRASPWTALIASEIVITAIAAMNAVLVWLDLINPKILLFFTFLLGVGAAFTAPAWQSIVPATGKPACKRAIMLLRMDWQGDFCRLVSQRVATSIVVVSQAGSRIGCELTSV